MALCDEGFFCPGRDEVPNPPLTVCPIGLHCPTGSSIPQPCVAGTYANFSQAAVCEICLAGYYCVPEEVVEGTIFLCIYIAIKKFSMSCLKL